MDLRIQMCVCVFLLKRVSFLEIVWTCESSVRVTERKGLKIV